MPYSCMFCEKNYGGHGAAGHMTQHLKDEHADKIEKNHDTDPEYGFNHGPRPLYKVYGVKVEWDEIEWVQRSGGAVPVDEAEP